MKKICSLVNKTYKENDEEDISIRVITDHIRSTTFMVGDGVLPSNEGRGYVLRRLLRRAARHGRLLGKTEPFLYEVCDTVIDENKSAYPELEEKRAYIKKVIQQEEQSFAKTVDKGSEILSGMIEELISSGKKVLDGADVFKLHDTYGFPLDLTREILEEKGFTVYIPDFDIYTQGSDLSEAMEMARDAIGLMGIDMEDDGKTLPSPTAAQNVKTADGDLFSFVDVDFAEYRRKTAHNCAVYFIFCCTFYCSPSKFYTTCCYLCS